MTNEEKMIRIHKLKGALKEAADLLQPVVQRIENSPQTTKDHYDAYMSVLSQAEPKQRKALALALVTAGANRNGVMSALKLVS